MTSQQAQDAAAASPKPTRIKVVTLFKRRKGLTVEEFRNYYESTHVKLFSRYVALPGVERYVRRYLEPMTDSISGRVVDSGFDCVMEVWFNDEALFEKFRRGLQEGVVHSDVVADEEKLFDRESISMNCVKEFYTKGKPDDE